MGSNEPSLVPEWLRSNGHGNNASNSSNHFGSASSRSDAPLLGNSARSRSYRTTVETNSPRPILERSSSISSRRILSNNGSSKNPYSSFSRSHRDREREKGKLGHGDVRERDSSDPMVESFRRTRSMVSRNQGDSMPQRVTSSLKNIETSNYFPRNGLVTEDKYSGSMGKVSFEKDFPSLGAEEKQVSNVTRVVSPSLPIGSSGSIGEGWSALVEVSSVIGSNNGVQSIHQPFSIPVASSSNSGGENAGPAALKPASATSNASSGTQKTSGTLGPSAFNMVEALVQSPPVSPTATQLSVETQRLEQMAIKKVRQLIPMTPAKPKVMNSYDKFKPRFNSKVSEISGAAKVGQQLSSPRSGHVAYDAFKQSHGSKLSVLKPQWESNSSSNSKDDGADIQQTITLNAAPAVSSFKGTAVSKASIMKRKEAISSLTLMPAVEKRPLSSIQSRSDFFSSVRKKTLMTNAVPSETDISLQSPSGQKSCELSNEIIPSSPQGTENGSFVNIHDVQKSLLREEKSSTPCTKVDISVEKEAAFLRSLGWDENGEEEVLTEEEINEFNQRVEKLNLSPSLSPGVQPASSLLINHHANNDGESSIRLSSPNAALESN